MKEINRKKLSQRMKINNPMFNKDVKAKALKTFLSNNNIPWNKGLTKDMDKRVEQYGINGSKTLKKLHKLGALSPPMKGKKMSKESCIKMSDTKKRLFKEGKLKVSYKTKKENSLRMKKNRKDPDFNRKMFKSFSKSVTKPHKKVQKWIKDYTKLITETNALFVFGNRSGSIDEANFNKKIAIYVDGNYWHNYPNGRRWDKFCSTYLKNRGWKVLRFWESDINKHPKKIIKQLKELK